MHNFPAAKILLLVVVVLFAGCGGKDVLLKPDYSKKHFPTDTSFNVPVHIAKVIDRRNSDPTVIGSAKVGMFNKTVPYKIDAPLSEFVRISFDTLFAFQQKDALTPAVAYIDSFVVGEKMSLFAEKGFVSSILRFGVPVTGDSLVFITTRFDEDVSSGVDVTDNLEPLIYRSINESGKQFAMSVKKLNLRTSSTDSLVSDQSLLTHAETLTIPIHTIEAIDTTERPKEYSDIGFMYSQGDIVQSGVRLFYTMLYQKKESKMMLGFGYNIEYFSIENTDAFLKGSMLTYGGTLVLRGMLGDGKVLPFVGLTANLIFGSETIDYGTSKESSFFFGPILRETIGLSLNKKVYVEAGIYELRLFGSKLLPDDIGFTAGLSFGI